MELLARKTVQEWRGTRGREHLDEYADASTQRGACMLQSICKTLGFDSLAISPWTACWEAIGIDRDQICTYCWTGKE
jgi:amidophosphoribosyltransferase